MTETLLHSAQVSEEGGRDRKWRTAHFLFLLSSASCCNKSICSVLAGGSDGWGGVGVVEGVHWKSEDHEQKVENEKQRLVVRREIAEVPLSLFDVSPG